MKEQKRRMQVNVVVWCLAIGCVLLCPGTMPDTAVGEEAKAVAEESKPVGFKDPADAYAQWLKAETPDVKPAAIKYLEQAVVKGGTDSTGASGACAQLIKIYQGENSYDKIIRVCAKQLEYEKDPTVIYTVITVLSSAYVGLADYRNAANVMDAFLDKNRSLVPPPTVLNAAQSLSLLYTDNLNQPNQAISMLDREVKNLPSKAVSERMGLINTKADIYMKNLRDPGKAELEYRAIIDAGQLAPATLLTPAYMTLAQIYADTDRSDKAVSTMLDFLKQSGSSPATAAVQKLFDYGANEQQLERAAILLQQKVADQSASSAAVDMFQPDIMQLLARAGKQQEAMQEARIFLYTCSEKSIPTAIDRTAWALKLADHNLARANAFLQYQKFGSAGQDEKGGTGDDLKDVLRETPPISDEQRSQMFKEQLTSLPKDWVGYKTRSQIYLYLDQPVEAFEASRKSFELCPMTTNDLQTATDVLTGLVIRNTKDVALAETLVQFIMFGPAGKDGKSGTTDDLKDPTPQIMQKIRCASVQPAAAEPTAKRAEPEP